MKKLLAILSLAALSSMTVQTETPNIKPTGIYSSKADGPRTSKHLTDKKIDCNAFLVGSEDTEIKTFVPDTTLTTKIPVLKPDPVDPGIFGSGECFNRIPKN